MPCRHGSSNYGNSSTSLGRGGGPPLLEILVIKGFFGILAVIKHFEQFAEGEKKLGKFRRRRKKMRGFLLYREGGGTPLLENEVIKGQSPIIRVISNLWL